MLNRFCGMSIIGLWLIFTLIGSRTAAQDNGALGISVLSARSPQLPTVQMEVVVTENGQRLGGLGASNFNVAEPNANLSVTEIQNQPIGVFIVGDYIAGDSPGLVRDTILTYVGEFMQAGEVVTLYGVNTNTGGAAQPVNDVNTAITTVQNWNATGTANKVGTTLRNSVLRDVTGFRQQNPGIPVIVLVVGGYINDQPEARNGLSALTGQGIPVVVVQASGRQNEGETNLFRQVAIEGNARFVANLNGSLVSSSGAIGELRSTYQSIAANRTAYALQFETLSADTQPTRNSVVSAETTLGSASANYSYAPAYIAPTITIVSPTNTNALRTPNSGSGGFDINSQPVYVNVSFSDRVPRAIEQIQLSVVDPALSDAPQQPILTVPGDQLAVEGNSFVLPWDLTGYNLPNDAYNLAMIVSVTDSLNLTGNIRQNVSVRVGTAAIPPTYTPLPTYTPPPPTPIPTATTPPLLRIPLGGDNPQNDLALDNPIELTFFITLLGVIVALIVAIIALTLFFTRTQTGRVVGRQIAKATTTAIQSTTQIFRGGAAGPSSVIPTPSGGGGNMFGVLIPIAGLEGSTMPIPITAREFILGRDLQYGVHFEIPNASVSGIHAAVIVNGDGSFSVADRGGADRNGIWVNDTKLGKGQSVPFPIGATLKLSSKVELRLAMPGSSAGPNTQIVPFDGEGNTPAWDAAPAAEPEEFGWADLSQPRQKKQQPQKPTNTIPPSPPDFGAGTPKPPTRSQDDNISNLFDNMG